MHDRPHRYTPQIVPAAHGEAARHPHALSPRPDADATPIARVLRDDEGSLVTEYGLLAVVGATIASLVIKWASGGAIFGLFSALTKKVRVMLGA